MSMMNYSCMSIFFSLPLYKDADSHALLNIKDILILCSVRRVFLLLAISMQVKHVNFIEALHKTLAHSTESGIIKVAVIGDECQDAITGLLDAPLRETDEFHIV